MESTDAKLWSAIGRGDRSAFAGLFDRHARAIYNFAFRRTADWSVAEDVVAIVFLESWRRRGKVRLSGDSALPWLYGVASNVLRNHARKRRRYGKALERLSPPGEDPGFEDDVVTRLTDQQTMTQVLELIGALPIREQEVLVLCLWEGLTYEEAALALGIPVGTVRSRLSRARAKLRDSVGEPDDPGGHEFGGRPTRPSAIREEYT